MAFMMFFLCMFVDYTSLVLDCISVSEWIGHGRYEIAAYGCWLGFSYILRER
jgi:hypothetical protein